MKGGRCLWVLEEVERHGGNLPSVSRRGVSHPHRVVCVRVCMHTCMCVVCIEGVEEGLHFAHHCITMLFSC